MPADVAVVEPEDANLSAYPWATLTSVLLTLVGATVLVVGNSDLSFDQFTDYALAGWAALALGRGLAAKPASGAQSGLAKILNSVPWATVVIGIIIATGALVLLVGESGLAFDEYFQKCLLAAGALGIARGVAAYKKDVNPLVAGETYSEPEYDPRFDTAADEPFVEAEGKEKI